MTDVCAFDPRKKHSENDHPLPEASERWLWITLAVGLGIALRLWQFRMNRSLWLDEAMLSLNILSRSPAELFKPLDYAQGAPVGFLLLEKLSVVFFGSSEQALRLPALLAGLISTVFFAVLARRLIGGAAGAVVTFLFSIACPLVYYSAETKQYGFDLLSYLAIMLCALAAKRSSYTLGRMITLAGVAVLSMAFSHASIFALASAGLGILIDVRGRPGSFRRLFGFGIALALIFALNYWFLLRPLTHHPELLKYWRKGFLPLLPHSIFEVSWIYQAIVEFFEDTSGLNRAAMLGLASATTGVIQLARRRNWFVLLILAGPFVFVLLGSAMQKYPFNGRLILFLVSPALILVGYGLQLFFQDTRREIRLAGMVAATLLLVDPSIAAFRSLNTPLQKQSIRPALQSVLTQATSDDLLLIGSTAEYQYRYYREFSKSINWDNAPAVKIVHPSWRAAGMTQYKHVWVIFSHFFPFDASAILDELEIEAHLIREDQINETRLYLYEPGQTPLRGLKHRPILSR